MKDQLAAAFLLGGAEAAARLLAEELRTRRPAEAVDEVSWNKVHHYVDFHHNNLLRWIDYCEVAPRRFNCLFFCGDGSACNATKTITVEV